MVCDTCKCKVKESNFTDQERMEFHLLRLASLASGMSYFKQMRLLNNIGLSNWCSSSTFDSQIANKMTSLENYLEQAANKSCEKWTRILIAEAKKAGLDCIQVSFDNSLSHKRNASSSSGEFVSFNIPAGRTTRPVCSFGAAMKKSASDDSLRKSWNYDGSSKQMEDFNLGQCVDKITR